jgi:predicted transcriptional regulator
MAGSLWVSNGVRRKGTSFNEVQDLFISQITTKHIYEKLYSAFIDDDANEVLNDLIAYDFDFVGVINRDKEVLGFISKEQLEGGVLITGHNKIDLNLIVTDSTPIHKLIKLLETRKFVFVMHGNAIDGIVTLADINKPVVRLYLFGIISLFEMHMNFWIDIYHPMNTWGAMIKSERLQEAQEIHELKKNKNEALSLGACLQFCDKRDILQKTDEFLTQCKYSKTSFKDWASNVEKIRNELAHSQNTVNAGMQWSDFVAIISELETFLEESDKLALSKQTQS